MTTALQLVKLESELNPKNSLIQTLKSYPEKTIHPDGTVTIEYIETDYFLKNDSWEVDFFFNIQQFQSQKDVYKQRKNFSFQTKNENLKLELKYLIHHQLFQDKWKLTSCFNGQQSRIKKLVAFLDEKYPTLNSLLDLEIEKAEKGWLFWLNAKGVSTVSTKVHFTYGEYTNKTAIANTLRNIYDVYFNLMDTHQEWEKDYWDVRVLNKKYGLDFNKSVTTYYIHFSQVSNLTLRTEFKKYIKQRLLSRNNFSVATAQKYSRYVSIFLNFISKLEPTWNDLKELNRQYIEKYIAHLNEYVQNELTMKDANPAHYIFRSLNITEKFLSDIQRYDYDIAPKTSIQKLIYPEDKPRLPKKSVDKTDYIPDFVLEQLFEHINSLHPEVVPIVYVAFKSGLRVSDVLTLNTDCLVRLKEKYYIHSDIQKVNLEGHRIPIDDELANLLAVEIQQSKENSNQDNNPENFIFIRYSGSRKGKPYSQHWVQEQLNRLAHQYQIKDESGKTFHFKMHQFRHTYGVKMLNGGADILVVQDLLGHASPEMTLTYAKLLDDTKRKAFDEVIKQGIFSFDNGNQIVQYQPGDDIPKDILETLYRDHKLTAMDNPYGTCHARLKGSCPHMEEPPCLTCNGGSPCKDLAIGFSELDVQKYELLVKTTSKSMELAEQHGREDLKQKNQKNLETYQSVLNKLQQGDVIFGNLNRVKRKRGE